MNKSALERVNALYRDALDVIAHYPGVSEDTAAWMKAKAAEALAKTKDAEDGIIYAQIGCAECDGNEFVPTDSGELEPCSSCKGEKK